MIEKNIQRQLQVAPRSNCESTALLLLRLIVGVAFIFHGWGKIQHPFNWMGPDAAIPGFFQFLAAISEFGGGIGLVLGFLTPLWSLGLICTMAVATHKHMIVRGDPFVGMGGGPSYELALVYLGISLLFFTMGPGKFSLDDKVFGVRR